MMSALNERETVQNPIIRYAVEAGWTYLPPDEVLRMRRGESGIVLHEILEKQLQRLNNGIVDHLKAEEIVRRLISVYPNIEGNFQVWEYLNGLKTVFIEEENRERNVQLLDLNFPERNLFHVTDEFYFAGCAKPIRADLVFFINGIPVIITEAKSATRIEGIAEALDQIRRYHREGPELMAVLQLYAITHLLKFYYGATWNTSRKGLYNWRDEQAGDFETLVKTFFAPRRILRVLTEFTLFARKDGELSKVVLRPHQIRATERIIKRAKDPEKKHGLVWHTQGSGKTYTMITVAKRLLEDPAFSNPTVLMLVDRNELEQQLFNNLEAVGFGRVQVTDSRRHLYELLSNDYRGLIVSMIHKFDNIPASVNMRDNIYVLVDEAHRTTGGKLGTYLMAALPNATYIGFTGTPIDKTSHGKGTFKVFGTDDPKGYLDKYSIRESIEDGTTVPLHYSLAPNRFLVDRATLEKEFLNLVEAEGVSDVEELDSVLEKAITLKNMLKNRERIDKIAEFVANHYKTVVEPMGYKAFLVAVDREACALYKEALDKYLPAEYSSVVISKNHNDPPELVRYHLTDEKEEQVRKAFRTPDSVPKILIVTEKLLTGYDAPILYCMYMDKPLRDHVLLQAIARVNRPYEDNEGRRKRNGFIMDFVGIFDNLEKALAFDSEDVQNVVEGIDVLKKRFDVLMEQGRKEYLPLMEGKTADKAAEAILEFFRDKEKRHEFYQYFKEIQDIYEIISPDPFLRPFMSDYGNLAQMYGMLRGNYEAGISIDREFLRKTARLVQKHTSAVFYDEQTEFYTLNEETLEKILDNNRPDTVKVFNLLKTIRSIVGQESHHSPYLIPIGERAEQIARAFEERQLTTKETLKQLEFLIREGIEGKNAEAESDLLPEGFAVFWLLKREGMEKAETAARKVQDAIKQFPYWERSAEQKRGLLIAVYKALIEAGTEHVAEFAEKIMKMLGRRAN
ncbi:type I site-specific deoxyribonuclease, HsdR family [Thermoclostridium stercorarium subsp. stercorarium DSM 8532]|uniref:Type I restriction enzyme endonuclease subunit n=1 Tax=Thermoclostridium stercorarium (strain ATCC 35414 / DSM 8532 / NCIMB 11754) TaxID=1121335 RepID=L7VK52_THES1|nr:HsdR family type I site-specific deoxyribonuclease [Thermoclostridium stercorarium]AGC68510.1 type I site-specific deoxyribonuclease, HsdR family [Thermoclostridium stercorarium subsp. stercorarium DSM 8532]AGI39527.1 deoxyribonuclease [Thermoclostridium stercorarium subsp. stercorarium DSM 8532]